MILVDTSCWVEALRENGRPEIRDRVMTLVRTRQARWCDAVRIELWNGRGGEQEQKRLKELETVVPSLPMSEEVWEAAIRLARGARVLGLTLPVPDLLIAACARVNQIEVESIDGHFSKIATIA